MARRSKISYENFTLKWKFKSNCKWRNLYKDTFANEDEYKVVRFFVVKLCNKKVVYSKKTKSTESKFKEKTGFLQAELNQLISVNFKWKNQCFYFLSVLTSFSVPLISCSLIHLILSIAPYFSHTFLIICY